MTTVQSIAQFNKNRESARQEQEEFLSSEEICEDERLKGDFSSVKKRIFRSAS